MDADLGPELSHALHHDRKIDFHPLRDPDAKFIGLINIRRDSRGSNDAFRRDTTDVETIASQKMALHKRDLPSQSGCAGCGHQPCCSCPDYHQVIAGGRFRILPIRRVDIGKQSFIVNVLRQNLRDLSHGHLL
jgi:hypothetical protein